MTAAKLFILGEERELLWIDTNYHRYTAANGSPVSDIEGGIITVCFVTQESDVIFLRNMTKKVENDIERMEKGEIHFYNKGDEAIIERKYKFNDAYLIQFSETFYADGTENMQTILTISPAIQNYGTPKDLVKHWQKSWISPKEPVYTIPKKEKKETRVKTIQLLSALDLGSANDGSGTEQEGMLYGRTYEFKVIEYTREIPADLSVINWMYRYHSLSQNKWIEKKLHVKGEILKFTLNERDMCGRFIYIRAYIKDPESEGEYKQWKHNRFRWFDRKQIKEEVKDRKYMPWLVNQDKTPTCGPSAIIYILAKNRYEKYFAFVLELHRTGYVISNEYKIDISEDDGLKKIAETNPKTKDNFPLTMAYADWIPNVCITEKENLLFNFEGNSKEDFSGITTPSRLVMLLQKLVGFEKTVDNTNLIFNKTGWIWGATIDNVSDLIRAKEEGFEVFLFISVNMLYNKTSNVTFSTAEHWIVLETIEYGDPGYVKMTVYTWGKEPKKRIYNLGYDVFRTNYYGYIKSK